MRRSTKKGTEMGQDVHFIVQPDQKCRKEMNKIANGAMREKCFSGYTYSAVAS